MNAAVVDSARIVGVEGCRGIVSEEERTMAFCANPRTSLMARGARFLNCMPYICLRTCQLRLRVLCRALLPSWFLLLFVARVFLVWSLVEGLPLGTRLSAKDIHDCTSTSFERSQRLQV